MDKAAGVPYWFDEHGPVIRLMVPSDARYGGTDPQLAKGQLDGKSPLETAIEEAEEELGAIRHLMTPRFFGQYSIQGMDGKYDMAVYLLHYRDPSQWHNPHYETKYTVDIHYRNRDLVRDIHRPIVDKIFHFLMNEGEE